MPTRNFEYRYKQADGKGLKLAIFAFLAIIVFLSFTTLYFYNKQIESLSTITNLQAEIKNKLEVIENKTNIIENMNSEISSKQLLINDLGNRLGLVESEVKQLTPIIKTYYTIGVSDGVGVVVPIEVKITKGTGLISVDIKNVEMLSDVQDSVRTAVKVAQDYTGIDFSKKDVTISFVNEDKQIVSIDGPSAGSVITTTIIAAAKDKVINKKILMTGTIEMDKSIGEVGGVSEKALAAKEFGATVFLVPLGEKVSIPGIEVVEITTIQEPVNLILS